MTAIHKEVTAWKNHFFIAKCKTTGRGFRSSPAWSRVTCKKCLKLKPKERER